MEGVGEVCTAYKWVKEKGLIGSEHGQIAA